VDQELSTLTQSERASATGRYSEFTVDVHSSASPTTTTTTTRWIAVRDQFLIQNSLPDDLETLPRNLLIAALALPTADIPTRSVVDTVVHYRFATFFAGHATHLQTDNCGLDLVVKTIKIRWVWRLFILRNTIRYARIFIHRKRQTEKYKKT